ncbi:hypothetical protein [Flammeovirga sp. EKP202]|uniref:hypothetical protein n=1 Tax=Flammeovirga sp. EKP202 TaxID=2770592 RepID=UPI001CB7CE4A|nr:hypothetical protein [Flammeovirga sp. EKP202]
MQSHKAFLIFLFGMMIILNVSGQNKANRYNDAYKQYLNATCPLEEDSIKHFVYFAKDRALLKNHQLLNIERIEGAQIMYSWRQLESQRGTYDFSEIREDYEYLLSHGKKLFIQFQDLSFTTSYIPVPDYLMSEEFDGGCSKTFTDDGVHEGWVAKKWNPAVQERFALLMLELGKEFDG